jgi:putative NIF3 family GTP cyclohydrolase 1 type 2
MEDLLVATVADIVKTMEKIAPPWLAEKWDNVGLQIGQKEWSVNTIWIALDPSYDVVHDACSHGVDLLITHHPLIFQPLKSINLNTGVGSIIHSVEGDF